MEQKEKTLSKLSDMFSDMTDITIRDVCEQQSYDVAKCIIHLMSIKKNRKNLNEAVKENTNPTQFHGAIPKNYNFNTNNAVVTTTMPQRARNNTYRNNKSNNNNNNQKIPDTEQRIAEDIKAGYRIMVLMRGAPGSGKSTQANALVEHCVPLQGEYTLKEFVFSADDYFVDPKGRYKYNVELLSYAHNSNEVRVRRKAEAGWSPIIVDNTNMKLWEMQSYVQIAVQNGYKIEILEPKTLWRNSAGKLAMKCVHKVPQEKIKAMLDKYEKGNVVDLLKMMKQTKYTLPLPQMRVHPPPPSIMDTQQDIETEEKFQIFEDSAEATWNMPAPLAQRENTHRTTLAKNPAEQEFEEQPLIPKITGTAWKTFDEEQTDFWGLEQQLPEANTIINGTKKSLLDLMREDINELQPVSASKSTEQIKEEDSTTQLSQYTTFQRHSTNCRNEHPAFVSLQQIYPNKDVASLWDLFVKCNGDIDWAVDILLKEDELSFGNTNEDDSLMQESNTAAFICDCDNSMSSNTHALLQSLPTAPQEQKLVPPLNAGVKPQRQRNRTPNLPIELQELKETLENRFILGDEHYSDHIRKLRAFRTDHAAANVSTSIPAPRHTTDAGTQTEPIYEEQDEDSKELVEISLEENLVQQLSDIFKMETVLTEQLPEKINANVFMPRALAKELYMLWVESVYNQIEEQRQQTLREDENFARLLKNPKYENCMQSPSNARELLDMEMAWLIYNAQREQEDLRQKPADLAARMTQMKLCDSFPDIPRETLLDILSAHDNNYGDTVELLRSNMDSNHQPVMQLNQNQLLERAMRENEVLNSQNDAQRAEQPTQGNNYSTHSSDDVGLTRGRFKSAALQPDEAKRLALRDFEDTRNLAAHHCQLKAECYQKAKEAIQKGNGAVAVYYSQIANLHKKKIDMYNHRAANCIMDVHKYTQNNPDLLDLHYLHVLEAVGCLDLFLDQHITSLRSASRSYKHVFIITGRGLHSAGGVSTIKNKVKSRLKERNLRWSEVNPGLLKVKIFSASRHFKNI